MEEESLSCSQNGSYKEFYTTAQFVTGLIAYPILCIIGLTGNVLSLLVFRHPDMRTSTNVYLVSLAVSDSIKLLNDLMYFILVAIGLTDELLSQTIISRVYPVAHYVFNMSVCVTAWLTVSVAVERYIYVCHASRARQLCTIPRARYVCSFVFVFMSLLTVPSALRYEMKTLRDDRYTEKTCPSVVTTQLGRNNSFMVPYSWILNSSRGIIPVFLLLFLNIRIINELRKERIKGKKLNARNRITLMLIVVFLLFLICITPDAIMSTFFRKGYVEEGFMIKGIREFTDTLLAVNSAFNFFLYFSMSMVFRQTCFKIFCSFQRSTPEKKDVGTTTTSPTEQVQFVVQSNGCTVKDEGDHFLESRV